MSEKQVNCILAFGVSAVLALMAWISLWSFLILPFIIILITEDNEDAPKLSSPKELKIELEKTHDRIEILENRLASAKHLNTNLQNRQHELERELAKLTEDPEAEMREIELAAEREIILQAKKEHARVDYSQEEEKLKNKVYQLQGRMNALTERLSELPVEMDAAPIYQQMQKIAETKKELEEKILLVKKQNVDFEMPVELSDYQKFLEMLRGDVLKAMTPQLKQKILCKLVEKVELLPEGMRIHFVVSASKIKKGLVKTGPSFNIAIRSSNSLTNGGGQTTTDERLYLDDFIELPLKTHGRIFEKCAPLYESGLSLKDISERTGIPKTSILKCFQENKFTTRNVFNAKTLPRDRHSYRHTGQPPYGFIYLDGKLVIDPKEHLIIRKMMKLHQKGRSMRAIAEELNNQKIPNRKNTKWHHSVISSIIKSQKKRKT